MGRLLLIIILVVVVIFTVISLSLQKNRQSNPEALTKSLSNINVKSLSQDALNYGIKRYKEGNLTYVQNVAFLSFNNFSVMSGSIDSIRFTKDNPSKNTLIEAHVSYLLNGTTNCKMSSALVTGSSTKSITNIISSNKHVDVEDDDVINGTIEENVHPKLKFDDYFGIKDKDLKTTAPNYYINPPDNKMPVNDVTYIDFSGSGKKGKKSSSSTSFNVTSSSWSGSGLLFIDGDANFSDGQFDGILWVNGELTIEDDFVFNGAIFAKDDIDIEDSDSVITFSNSAVEQTIENASISIGGFEILSWFDD